MQPHEIGGVQLFTDHDLDIVYDDLQCSPAADGECSNEYWL